MSERGKYIHIVEKHVITSFHVKKETIS